jgi:hypothetical protein
MSPDTKMTCGIIILTIPTIQYGGYFLLSILSGKQKFPLTDFQKSMFRAGLADFYSVYRNPTIGCKLNNFGDWIDKKCIDPEDYLTIFTDIILFSSWLLVIVRHQVMNILFSLFL